MQSLGITSQPTPGMSMIPAALALSVRASAHFEYGVLAGDVEVVAEGFRVVDGVCLRRRTRVFTIERQPLYFQISGPTLNSAGERQPEPTDSIALVRFAAILVEPPRADSCASPKRDRQPHG